jgi:hypothetical protein
LTISTPTSVRPERLGTLLGEDEARLAIVDPERQPLRTKQREQWHGNGATLDGPEQTHIERLTGIEHDGYAVASGNAHGCQPVGEAAGELSEDSIVVVLTVAIGKLDADRRALVPMAVDALMGEIHVVAVAIKQGPEAVPRKAVHHVVVGSDLGQFRHTRFSYDVSR